MKRYSFQWQYIDQINPIAKGWQPSRHDPVLSKTEADRLLVEQPHPMAQNDINVIYRVVVTEVANG